MCLNAPQCAPGNSQYKHSWSMNMFNANHLLHPPVYWLYWSEIHQLQLEVMRAHTHRACLMTAGGALVVIDPPPPWKTRWSGHPSQRWRRRWRMRTSNRTDSAGSFQTSLVIGGQEGVRVMVGAELTLIRCIWSFWVEDQGGYRTWLQTVLCNGGRGFLTFYPVIRLDHLV